MAMPNIEVRHNLSENMILTGRLAYSGWKSEQSNEHNALIHPEFFLSWDGWKNNSLITGFDYRYMNFERTAVLKRDQQAAGVFIQDELEFNRISLSAALRFDKVEKIKGVLSPKLGILYRPASFVRFRFTFGRGFHAPTMQELYEEGYGHGGRAYRFGNPDLQPEFSLTSTLSTEFLITKNLQLFLYGYYNLIDDMITPVYSGPWEADSTIDKWVRTNIYHAKIYGSEIYASWKPFNSVRFKAGYTYTHNVNVSTGLQLPYYPGQSYFGKIVFNRQLTKSLEITGFINFKGVIGRSSWNWKPDADATPDNPDGLVTPLKDYQLLNAGVKMGIKENFEIFLNAHNILQQEIETLDDVYTVFRGEVYYRTGIHLYLNP
jgi:outer membrane receptor protein involved in Fe transport